MLGEVVLDEKYDDLEDVVRKIHAEHMRGTDDTCWLDIDRVFAALGLPAPERSVGSKTAMLENCTRFIGQLCTGRKDWPSYVDLEKRIKELEAENDLLRRGIGARKLLTQPLSPAESAELDLAIGGGGVPRVQG